MGGSAQREAEKKQVPPKKGRHGAGDGPCLGRQCEGLRMIEAGCSCRARVRNPDPAGFFGGDGCATPSDSREVFEILWRLLERHLRWTINPGSKLQSLCEKLRALARRCFLQDRCWDENPKKGPTGRTW